MSSEEMSRQTVQGTVRIEGGRGVVRMDDHFDTDIDDLWSALTEPPRLQRWLAEVVGEPRLGELLQARFASGWEGQLRVEVCDQPNRLVVTSDPGSADETVMEAVLTAVSSGVRLVIEERGFAPDEVAAHGAGWQAHIEDLGAHLEQRDRVPWAERWRELAPGYTQMQAGLT